MANRTVGPIGAGRADPSTLIKGWIVFKGVATASIYASYNVSSLVRNGQGSYTVTWQRALNATTYAGLRLGSGLSVSSNTLTVSSPTSILQVQVFS